MALADTARLAVQLDLKGNFSSQLRANQKLLGNFDKSVDRSGSRAFKAGQQIGTGIKNGTRIAAGAVGFLAANIALGLNSLVELEKATAQTNAVIKSTKGVAGQTAASIRNLAEKYEALNATVDDKAIQSAANVLLTFTSVGKKAFEPAIQAALDMSTALGTDLQGSVIQIGKALQDPIKGITALRRVGVNFSASQIKVIKRLVETGKTLDAQKLILKELNTEFGGSFLAQGNTTAGKVAKFQDSIEDLQKALATALLPTVGKVADRLSKFLADPQVTKTVERLGESIASLFNDDNMAEGGKILGSLLQTAKAAAPVMKDAAIATLGAVKAAVGLFTSLPKEVQQLAVGAFAINKITGGLVTNLAGGLIGNVLKQLVSGVVNVRGASVIVTGAGVPAAGAPVAGAAKTGLSTLSKVFLVGEAIGLVAAVNEVRNGIERDITAQASGVRQQADVWLQQSPSLNDLKAGLAAVDTGIDKLNSDPIGMLLVGGPGLEELRQTRQGILANIARVTDNTVRTVAATERAESRMTAAQLATAAATRDVRSKVEANRIAVAAAANRNATNLATVRDRVEAARIAVAAGAARTASAAAVAGVVARGGGLAAAAAIRNKDLSVRVSVGSPQVSIRQFIQGTLVTSRYGVSSATTRIQF